MADGYKKLGEQLLASGQITNLQLSLALAVQRTSSRRLGEILVSKGFVSEQQVAEVLAKQYNYPIADPECTDSELEALALVSFDTALQSLTLPVRIRAGVLECFIADPIDIITSDWLSRSTGYRLSLKIATQSQLTAAIQRQYARATSRSSGISGAMSAELPARYSTLTAKQGFTSGVYDSFDETLKRDVCLIEFSPAGNEKEVEELVQRTARFSSRTNTSVFDLHKQSAQTWWVSVEPFTGETLAHLIETRGRRTPSQAATIVTALATLISTESAKRGAFGFLSPDNVVLSGDDFPIMLPLSTNVTPYRFPIDLERSVVTSQSDIYALGCILSFCLTGRVQSTTFEASIPKSLSNIIARCQSSQATERYESLNALLADLHAVNWSALATTSFSSIESSRQDRDELLRDISNWNSPKKQSIWSRLMGRKAA